MQAANMKQMQYELLQEVSNHNMTNKLKFRTLLDIWKLCNDARINYKVISNIKIHKLFIPMDLTILWQDDKLNSEYVVIMQDKEIAHHRLQFL